MQIPFKVLPLVISIQNASYNFLAYLTLRIQVFEMWRPKFIKKYASR